MRKFKTVFKNWDDALYFGFGGTMSEETFENWEFVLKRIELGNEEWGSVYISADGYNYPETRIVEVESDYDNTEAFVIIN